MEIKKSLNIFAIILLLFWVSMAAAVSYETEPNNDKSQADALVSGSPIIGQLSSKTDQDWYYVCTSDADVISVSFYKEHQAYGGQPSWSISIEDSSGNVLSQIVHYGYGLYDETSQLLASVANPGIYYVVIELNANYGNGGDANYTLTTSVSNPGQCPTGPPQYDVTGIWQMGGQNYYLSLYITGSTAIAVTYIPGAGESYMLGTISGNTGRVTYASDLAEFDATFTFTSPTTGTMTVNKCVPFSGEYCILPAGVTVNAIKIF